MNSSTINTLMKDICKLRIEMNQIMLENIELRETIEKLTNQGESTASNDYESDESAESDATSECSDESAESDESDATVESDATSECSDESDATVESAESTESAPVESPEYEYASHTNYELAHLFHQLAEKQDDDFKKNAYMNVARIIKDFPAELTSSSQISHVRGIGKATIRLINEYMATGTFKKLQA